ncbi:MAG: PEP/pyruvate-binding domain-containing protein, partial [Saprospiraceae bacterium]|nr:PEP/pyruvate-binding domain-containing protein [Saprospiraceae bacterium]
FLGQILSTTPYAEFWDAGKYNSRLKQYQLERYLRSVDDGWILRKAQYYRGAYQVEDEEAWGIEFFRWLLADDEVLRSQFFLVRQASKDIPHRAGDSRTLNIRAVSKAISDAYPPFMNLRVKIHGQPEAADLGAVRAFRTQHQGRLSAGLDRQFDELIRDMEAVYQEASVTVIRPYLRDLPADAEITRSLTLFADQLANETDAHTLAMGLAEKLSEIREQILVVKSPRARLALLDISNLLEEMFFVAAGQWKPESVRDAMNKICYAGLAVMSTGFVEVWEWEALTNGLAVPESKDMALDQVRTFLQSARSLLEWGAAMVNGVYKDVITTYSGFEPLALGFYDDRVRASALLPLGETVGTLGSLVAKKAKLTNQVLGLSNQATFRGLNPGIALGELVVVEGNEEDVAVANDKIYIFHHPPSDLKPVAGILTVTEGNLVSHVQLLARNLAIPNAVLTAENMQALKAYAGQRVFYAVSNQGTVIMKAEKDMTADERALFAKKERSEERVTVPVERTDLSQTGVLNMRAVNAASSGVVCGPKAANLGQLKALFPEHVVEGLVIPFGIFRQHMDQSMPGQSGSYWDYLNRAFARAGEMRSSGSSEADIEQFVLGELQTLREAISRINLLPAFVADLEKQFRAAFSKEIGNVPVFLRSDTNMEDLKDFTGAGLNLTLFNVVDRQKIIQGIKDVWASPYTERSFKWRQRYLLNPEHVFPSILIIPSVDVDYSGVLITKGIPTDDDRDLTIAFSRGAGGAVDGQAAESYLLSRNGKNYLLAPAREPTYRRLPETGGTATKYATFEQPILSGGNLADLRQMAQRIKTEIKDAEVYTSAGPYDVELGFRNDKIWLFQIRPFVENKNAVSSEFLASISPKIDGKALIQLNQKL